MFYTKAGWSKGFRLSALLMVSVWGQVVIPELKGAVWVVDCCRERVTRAFKGFPLNCILQIRGKISMMYSVFQNNGVD